MPTTRLARLPQIVKHARRPVDTMARRERRPDQSQPPGVLSPLADCGHVNHWSYPPGATPSLRHMTSVSSHASSPDLQLARNDSPVLSTPNASRSVRGVFTTSTEPDGYCHASAGMVRSAIPSCGETNTMRPESQIVRVVLIPTATLENGIVIASLAVSSNADIQRSAESTNRKPVRQGSTHCGWRYSPGPMPVLPVARADHQLGEPAIWRCAGDAGPRRAPPTRSRRACRWTAPAPSFQASNSSPSP